MTPATIRVLRDPPGDPATNMAVDEALLTGATEPTLRLYGWQPHAVSLGYFQRRRDFADLPTDTVIVRRLTGGGAIHHGDELTFALALPAELLGTDVAGSYRGLHDAVVRALRDVGVDSTRLDSGHAQTARPEDRWCFRTPGRDDIVTGHGKLVGSAQRRIARPARRVLHHGSLVLSRPTLTPFVAAVADTVAVDAALTTRLGDRLVHHLAGALDLAPKPGELTNEERQHAEQLRRTRYANPEHTNRR